MKEKKWSVFFIGIYFLLLVLIGGIVYIVDPYFHYHKPLEGMAYSVEKEAYVNDGISRNFDYNALITGTSMTLGFDTQEANELFDKEFVRLTFQGEGFRGIGESLVRAIEYNSELELVIRGVDTLWFTSADDKYTYEEYPTYLYDDVIWNDVKYLYNKDVLVEDVIPQIMRTIKGVKPYEFDDTTQGGRTDGKGVLAAYEREEKRTTGWTESEEQYFFEMLERNLDNNVFSVIEDNADVTFYLFFPPYSIVFWDQLNQGGSNRIEQAVAMERVAIEKVFQYDNVRLFSFFNNFEMVCDLHNYRDMVHYTDDVCSQILACMKNGEYEVTKENYEEYLTEIREFYCNYDYESLFE